MKLNMLSKKMFVHIPKNGGMSIRKSPEIRPKIIIASKGNHKSSQYTKNVKETMDKNKEHHGFEHARWRDWNEDARNTLQAFAIVRNPWDRVVSRYLFARKVMFHEQTQPKDYIDASSFENFLETRHEWADKEYFWHRAIKGWYPALDHVTDENGRVRCDMMRFEHYDEDISKYFGLPSNHVVAPRNVTRTEKGGEQNTGWGLDYKSLYTEQTIQIVADWYKKDIDYWGFDFDTAATRNYWNV